MLLSSDVLHLSIRMSGPYVLAKNKSSSDIPTVCRGFGRLSESVVTIKHYIIPLFICQAEFPKFRAFWAFWAFLSLLILYFKLL